MFVGGLFSFFFLLGLSTIFKDYSFEMKFKKKSILRFGMCEINHLGLQVFCFKFTL